VYRTSRAVTQGLRPEDGSYGKTGDGQGIAGQATALLNEFANESPPAPRNSTAIRGGRHSSIRNLTP
jgi:hypothetical protein